MAFKWEVKASKPLGWLLKGAFKAALAVSLMYCGDAVNMQHPFQRTFLPEVAKDSYAPYKLDIKASKEWVDGRKVTKSYYVKDDVKYLIGAEGFPQEPLEVLLNDPRVESEIEKRINDFIDGKRTPVENIKEEVKKGGRTLKEYFKESVDYVYKKLSGWLE